MLGLADDRPHELLAGLDRQVGLLQHQLGEAPDGHQGLAEIVGHHPHELALQAVVLLEEHVGLLDLVVEAQVLDRDGGLAGQGQEQVQVLVGEQPELFTVGDREKAQDRRPPGDGDQHQRAHLQLRHQARQQPGVLGRLVGEQWAVLAEVPPGAGLAVHRVAHPLHLLGGEAEARGLGDELTPLAVVEQHQAAPGLQHLGAVLGDVTKEGLGASGQGEGPGHLVEPEELTALLLQRSALGLVPKHPAHPHQELAGLEGLGAEHVVDLLGRVVGVEVVEDQDPRVGAEGLTDSAHDGGHRWVDQRERGEEEVGGGVDHLLDDPAAGNDYRDPMAGGAEDVGEILSPLGVLVDDGDMARGPAGRGVHRRTTLPNARCW